MNNFVKKNYHIDKEDIKRATANVIDILEKKKKVIIAHDKGKRRNAILGRTIKYMLNSARKKGIEKPVVLSIRFNNSERGRSNQVIYNDKIYGNIFSSNLIQDDENIVAIVINDFEMLSHILNMSTPLLELVNYIKNKCNIMYEVMTTSEIHNNPICLPFITFRAIDNKFAKLSGIEGTSHLAELFYDTSGETKPKESAYIVNKKIAEYADVDLYNYVDADNFIKPDVSEYNTNEELIDGALEKITQLDMMDEYKGLREKKKFHVIIHNNVSRMSIDNIDQFTYYAKKINNRIEKIVLCKDIDLFDEWNTECLYENKKGKETIFVTEKNNNKLILGPQHVTFDLIRSVSFLCGSEHSMNMTLENFMNIYKIAYSTYYHSDENKIFVHCINKYLTNSNYSEMQYLLTKDLPEKFNKNALQAFYDNYINAGSLNKCVKATVKRRV